MRLYYKRQKPKKNIDARILKKCLAFLILAAGIGIFLYFAFPIISWQIYDEQVFARGNIEVPIPKYLVVRNNNPVSLFRERVQSLFVNYENARNWYPNILGTAGKNAISSYLLSIPSLSIKDATVSTVDYDLTRHLVQYFGTFVPGQKGTAIIFGHSTLPQLFNPKDYKTIFANLHKVKIGDNIIVNIGGIEYTYRIFEVTVKDAEDTDIFSQAFDNSYITLVTCYPPGTTWKRLVVRAQLTTKT